VVEIDPDDVVVDRDDPPREPLLGLDLQSLFGVVPSSPSITRPFPTSTVRGVYARSGWWSRSFSSATAASEVSKTVPSDSRPVYSIVTVSPVEIVIPGKREPAA